MQFHPLVQSWFAERFGAPTEPQAHGWAAIAAGRHTLIAAPTGSGKTLAAFLWSINRLVERAVAGNLADRTQVVYVSPLKALGNDIEKNLRDPLEGVRRAATESGIALPEIRVAVRSGDTPAVDRSRMLRRPPHILITTPETFFILLTAEGSRTFLADAKTVIVDEIHAVAGDKRGSHLAISLERLDALVGAPVQRIGLSATQRPIEEVAALLVGAPRPGEPRDDVRQRCAIVDVGHRRPMRLSVAVPDQELGPIASHELWAETYDRIAREVQEHRATLVFVNTRRQVERVAHALGQRLGDERVAAHHGSLSRETRLKAEQALKTGAVPVMVATASLELGIDIGYVDLVCHIGAPRLFATLLQRVGRSGHWLGAIPHGILYPMTRDDLLQSAAAIRGVRAGELDRLSIPENALDILAQQMVAIAASGPIGEDDLFDLVRRAHPYRNLPRRDFDAVLEMLSEGIATERGRRSAHLHLDRVHRVIRPRRGARLAAITSGGAIPDVADYDVIEDPAGIFVGKVHEDFAVESLAGDIFLLGNHSWRIRRVEAGRVRVEDAQGAPPTIPFWFGEAPARSLEMSASVSALREEVARRLPDRKGAVDWVVEETDLDPAGAEQIVDYVDETVRMLGAVPSQRTIVAERFFDEAGGMQLVVHAPFGGRINRAWGLALRKRFCVTFDFELQAAATDDGIVISLGERHSFPLASVFGMVRTATLEQDLIQATLKSPMFTNRWRWNAGRSLALLRHQGGRRVPMNIQRMRAEDLLAAVFPAQVACQDNMPAGPITPPDHPLVNETIDNCLHEAMDIDGLRDVLDAIQRGEIEARAVETPAPSPMSHEILNANPYAFLDDAPLEERRARAVSLRRVDPDLASGIGALDPEAIATVRAQAWPDVRDADDLHDALLNLGILPVREIGDWDPWARALIADRRATVAARPGAPAVPSPLAGDGEGGGERWLVAAERLSVATSALGPLSLQPVIEEPAGAPQPDEDAAARQVVQGWLEVLGPTSASALAERTGLRLGLIEMALAALEGSGMVLRGQFTANGVAGETEWCERRLLARIHRLTLGRLRQEIQPVTVAEFIRFLLQWQHVATGTQVHGREGLAAVVGQLQGLELPAPSWEQDVLPARVSSYDPADLEQLCLAGVVAWGRLSSRPGPTLDEEGGANGARRRKSAPGRQAPVAFLLRDDLPFLLAGTSSRDEAIQHVSPAAQDVARYLMRRGASFLGDVARGTGRLPSVVEEALWELVASGLATGDGVAGLRALLLPETKRRAPARHLRALRGGRAPSRAMPVGRWSLWGDEGEPPNDGERAEWFARQLLRRWGVVFRDLLARETQAPPWRVLLGIFRRLEARGEIRGGRFVAGFVGEQFA
ncbi:MAG TPA: DEAD/DEAH box helicase, partial [Chloroflexota bacterium]|nr:DEAD/DEAH box helicase [Chloroflexota bacterium]